MSKKVWALSLVMSAFAAALAGSSAQAMFFPNSGQTKISEKSLNANSDEGHEGNESNEGDEPDAPVTNGVPTAKGGLPKDQFLRLNAELQEEFQDDVNRLGGILVVRSLWNDETLNANAARSGPYWRVRMYGGLARRPEINNDAFTLVICHEVGHLLGGYPYLGWYLDRPDLKPLAAEGEADYFATQVCARRLWSKPGQLGTNARFRKRASKAAVFACNQNWTAQADRDLCYRISEASLRLATLLSRMNMLPADPEHRARDREPVDETNEMHPPGQCRLDTYTAGSLCNRSLDSKVIPGLQAALEYRADREVLQKRYLAAKDGHDEPAMASLVVQMNTLEHAALVKMEREAMKYSCPSQKNIDPMAGIRTGARPRCWFKPVE